MRATSFWGEELRDLKSKLRLLGRVWVLVLLPSAVLLFLGVPARYLNVLVVAGAAVLGLSWLTRRLRMEGRG